MVAPYDILQKYIQPGLVLLNRYQIERPIGTGAYGSIFLAMDLSTHEHVAVKVLPPPAETSSRTAQDRFKREMKIISSLVHPNIISIYDYGKADHGIPFMVLEYLQGKTLEQQVERNPMSLVEGLETVRQIAAALQVAHTNGIIHRDLKPANIMVMPRQHGFLVKVLDFGMAKLLSKLDDESLVQLTREGVAVGTPRYIAPEQARGQEVGPWTDLYALGLLVYEIFTGQRAVKANTIEEAVRAHVSPEPLRLDEVHMVPEVVQPLMHKLLAKDHRKRYQRAQHLIDDIERIERQLRQPKLPQGAQAQPGVARPRNAVAGVELDYDKAAQADVMAREGYTGIQAGAQHSSGGVKLDDTREQPFAWFERVLAVIGAVFVYTFWTASFFYTQPYHFRLVLGLVPYITITIVAFMVAPRSKSLNVARVFLLGELVMFTAAHIPPKRLILQFIRDPAWYVAPFQEAFGFRYVYHMVKYIAREYAMMISPLVT